MAVDPQITRQCRRLYVGNLPVVLKLTEQQVTDLFTSTVIALGITTPQPIISTWLSAEGTFGFVEFRSIQDTTFALSLLQGLQIGGRTLRIGRPQDYKPPALHLQNYVVGFPLGTPAPLPSFASNATFMQLLAAGQSPLTNPTMMLLLANPNMDPNAAAQAQSSASQTSAPTSMASSVAPSVAPSSISSQPTNVLLLENMVSLADLTNDEEFQDLLLDIKDEVVNYGPVRRVVIPRPHIPNFAPPTNQAPSSEEGPRVPEGQGTGRIFIEYDTPESAATAQKALHGRIFNASQVVASFFSPQQFEQKKYI